MAYMSPGFRPPGPPAVHIRAKQDSDTPALLPLLLAVHHADGYPRHLPADQAAFVTSRHETAAWVALRAGQIVGHIALHQASGDPTLRTAQRATELPPDQLAVVARLLVAPTIRRAGLGRQLLTTATEHAAARGQQAVLDVVQDAMAPIALYEAAGWSRLEPVTLGFDDGTSLDLWVYLAPMRAPAAAGDGERHPSD